MIFYRHRNLLLLFALGAFPAQNAASATLTWQSAVTGNLSAAANWSPAQSPATADILVFPNAASSTLTNDLGATVALAAVQFTNEQPVVINSAASQALSINPAGGGDFTKSGAGSVVVNSLIVSTTASAALSFSVSGTGDFKVAGGLTGPVGLDVTKQGGGTGVLEFSGSHTYTIDQFRINNGTVKFDGGTVNSALIQIGNEANNRAELNLAGNATLGASPLTINGDGTSNLRTLISGGSDRTLSGALFLGESLTVSAVGSNTITLSGVISDEAGGSQPLTLDGSGTVVLTNPGNSYSDGTIVKGGTLLLGADGVLPGTASLTLQGGQLSANGKEDKTIGPLLLSASSTIDLAGAGGSELWFANSSGSWGTHILSIWNWNPSTTMLRFGTSASGLSSIQLSKITAYYGAGSSPVGPVTLDSNGFLVAVPEPGAVLSGLLLLGIIGWRERFVFLRRRSPV